MTLQRFSLICVGMITLGLLWGTILPADSPAKSLIRWEKNIFAAHDVSLKTGKPMLFVFGADWCTYCNKLEKNTLNHPQMANYVNSTFVPVHLDFDRDKRIADILGVDKIPCTVVLSPEADLLGQKFGYLTPIPYYNVLKSAHQLQHKNRQVSLTIPAPRR